MSRLGGQGDLPLVVVDYSHTPDALEQALTALRAHCAGRLICVFGCGGERDAGKRPLMGEIAARLADEAIVTDDNPRRENGDAIVAQIVAGMPEGTTIERDRAAAIALALRDAHAGDVVLIAGRATSPTRKTPPASIPSTTWPWRKPRWNAGSHAHDVREHHRHVDPRPPARR